MFDMPTHGFDDDDRDTHARLGDIARILETKAVIGFYSLRSRLNPFAAMTRATTDKFRMDTLQGSPCDLALAYRQATVDLANALHKSC